MRTRRLLDWCRLGSLGYILIIGGTEPETGMPIKGGYHIEKQVHSLIFVLATRHVVFHPPLNDLFVIGIGNIPNLNDRGFPFTIISFLKSIQQIFFRLASAWRCKICSCDGKKIVTVSLVYPFSGLFFRNFTVSVREFSNSPTIFRFCAAFLSLFFSRIAHFKILNNKKYNIIYINLITLI